MRAATLSGVISTVAHHGIVINFATIRNACGRHPIASVRSTACPGTPAVRTRGRTAPRRSGAARPGGLPALAGFFEDLISARCTGPCARWGMGTDIAPSARIYDYFIGGNNFPGPVGRHLHPAARPRALRHGLPSGSHDLSDHARSRDCRRGAQSPTARIVSSGSGFGPAAAVQDRPVRRAAGTVRGDPYRPHLLGSKAIRGCCVPASQGGGCVQQVGLGETPSIFCSPGGLPCWPGRSQGRGARRSNLHRVTGITQKAATGCLGYGSLAARTHEFSTIT